MAGLVDRHGNQLTVTNKKAPPPKLGEAFGPWAGRDVDFAQLPGGGVIQFDLSKLTLADYRSMRDHYQVNASLAVLSFMQHQADWHIECEDKQIAEEVERQLRAIWTPLNRAMATANWAGYSPNVLQWENDVDNRKIVLNKVKDMIPEECTVNWKQVEGYAPPDRPKPKYKIYDGIKIAGTPYPVPTENSYWYPLLMENGDYYGRKLLRPAFQSWFFSILVHLFANRYYERFGEPVPIGRAPFDDTIDVNGNSINGADYMLQVLQNLRNRSVVVMPNDRTMDSTGAKPSYDYDLEYLESQMRGADFERYLTRLDEEVSLALFTPILLLRTADVGSYNLGVGHMQVYLWMLNAMNGDRALYIDKYVINRIVDFNFSPKAPRANIVFKKLGNQNADLLQALITGLVSSGKAKPSIEELGQMAGMTLTEVRQTTADPAPDPAADPAADPAESDPNSATGQGRAPAPGTDAATGNSVVTEIVNRVRSQVRNAAQRGELSPDASINMGYKRKVAQELGTEKANSLYAFMDQFVQDLLDSETEYVEFMREFQAALEYRYNFLADSA